MKTSENKNILDLDLGGNINTSFTSTLKSLRPLKVQFGNKKPYIIRMNKGELCNFDAYGAFAYHVSYEENEGKLNEVDIVHNPSLTPEGLNWKKLSTGLAEFLINPEINLHKKPPSNLSIDVCGLVTNICVVSICVTGCKVFKALGFDKYNFNILNEYCMNLPGVPRNAQKIINDNKLKDKITISDKLDVNNFNPTICFNN